MLITISGTPGAGKTKAAQILGKMLKADLIATKYLVRKYEIKTKNDAKRKTRIIDEKMLVKAVAKESMLHKVLIYEGHLAHFPPAEVKVILRTSPRVLEKRLKSRKWAASKIRENVEAEALGIISSESNALEIDTSKRTPRQTAGLIKRLLNNYSLQKTYRKKIDWKDAYAKYLRG